MSDPEENGGNRTVFRPSPLSGMKPAAPPPPMPQNPGVGREAPPPAASAPQRRLVDDDIPQPSQPRASRNLLMEEASALLALAASVRSGRARIAMPDFHRQAREAIEAFDRTIAASYSAETRQHAGYAIAATVDDIAQNLPNVGHDGSEWARRSLLLHFHGDAVGGKGFWQRVDDMLARPAQNTDLIELYHACLAAGFEGRYRVMPEGRSQLQAIMASLYGALEHARSLSQTELSPQWKGANAPLARVGLFNQLWLVGAASLFALLLVFILLRVILMWAGQDGWNAVAGLSPREPLRLSRVGAQPPAPLESAQLVGLRKFLEPEIRAKLVTVEEDGSTVRVRTTVGKLFEPASDQLVSDPEKHALFERIGRALEGEKGVVTVEGHADSDRVSKLAFPDNLALSKARAETVARVIGEVISNPGRIVVEGYGDTQPVASNATEAGKALNRRVEIVVPRRQ